MLIHGQKLSTLMMKKKLGQATRTELMHLEEWASLDTNKRAILDRINNNELVESRLKVLANINRQKAADDFKRRLAEYYANEPVLRKLSRKAWKAYFNLRDCIRSFRKKTSR